MDAIEILRIIHFDRHRQVLGIAEYCGDAVRVAMPMREIIGEALRLGSAGLLLSHNHPSGDPTPSRADIDVTGRLIRTAEALDIRVHDHLILGWKRHVSFRALGLI